MAIYNVNALPALVTDFGNPTDGLESPWGQAQLVFAYDRDVVKPPHSADALKDWIINNPGRFTFPQPPAFTGTSFLKQIGRNSVLIRMYSPLMLQM